MHTLLWTKNTQPSAQGSRSDLPSRGAPAPASAQAGRRGPREGQATAPTASACFGPHVSWQLRPAPSCHVQGELGPPGVVATLSPGGALTPPWMWVRCDLPSQPTWGPHPALDVESGATRPMCHMRTPAAQGPCDHSLPPRPFHSCSLHAVGPRGGGGGSGVGPELGQPSRAWCGQDCVTQTLLQGPGELSVSAREF